MQEMQVWEGPLEKEMATHSSILAREIPWTEEPEGLQSLGSQRVGHDWSDARLQILQVYHYHYYHLGIKSPILFWTGKFNNKTHVKNLKAKPFMLLMLIFLGFWNIILLILFLGCSLKHSFYFIRHFYASEISLPITSIASISVTHKLLSSIQCLSWFPIHRYPFGICMFYKKSHCNEKST